MSFQETLRRLAVFDEGLAKAGLGSGRSQASALDAKSVALLQVAVVVAIGSSAVCLEWGAARALAATGVLFGYDQGVISGALSFMAKGLHRADLQAAR